MRYIACMHGDQRVVEACRQLVGRAGCIVVEDWAALRAALRDAPPSAVAILDPYAGDAAGQLAPEARALMDSFPYVPVIAAFRTRERVRDLIHLARWGVADVVSLDFEPTYEAIRHRLDETSSWALRRIVVHAAPAGLNAAATSLLHASVEVVCRQGDAEMLAKEQGVTRRTITRWFERARLPTVRRLMAWLRLLLAAEYLDDPRRRVAQIAHSTGYASDNNLRTALSALLGKTPSQLRSAGAVRTALPLFWNELRVRK